VGFIGNGLNLIGVEPFWQYVAKGVALVVAVILDRIAGTERRYWKRERNEESLGALNSKLGDSK
jgi:ribose/xylose/arabinose/galactoside ABC-type transport system permease subunit